MPGHMGSTDRTAYGLKAQYKLCKWLFQFSSVQFSRSVLSDSLQPHESQHARLLSITNSRSSLYLDIKIAQRCSEILNCSQIKITIKIYYSLCIFLMEMKRNNHKICKIKTCAHLAHLLLYLPILTGQVEPHMFFEF